MTLNPSPNSTELVSVSRRYECSQMKKKVDTRLTGKGNSTSHGARPFRQIILMIRWIQTSRLSIKNSLSQKVETCTGFLYTDTPSNTLEGHSGHPFENLKGHPFEDSGVAWTG